MITIPQRFLDGVITHAGPAGQRWAAQLPALIDHYCARWQLTITGAPRHGYLSLVLPARREEEACVLKVAWLDESNREEAQALAAWHGEGAVRLLASEPAHGVLLLEQLDATRPLRSLPASEAIPIAGRLLRRLAIPAPAGFRSLRQIAADFGTEFPVRWAAYGRSMPCTTLDRALTYAAALGPAADHLLVNYDLHDENVLAGEREPWLVIDPKVVAGDVEYGIAQLLWRQLDEIEADGGLDRYFPLLVEAAALEPDRARRWTLVRCVDYWLWGLSVGLTEDPRRCARLTDWLLAQ